MKLRPLIGAVIAAGMVALAAWGSVNLFRAANTATSAPIPFTKVKRGDVTFAVYARGELQGGNSIMLQAPMVGGAQLAITELRTTGELIKKDDVVVQFDTTDQVYKLKEAQADLAEAEQKVVQAEAQMDAKEEEDRYALIKARADLKQAQLEARKNPLVGVIQARENDLAVRSAQETVAQLEHDQANRKANSLAIVKVQEALRDKAKVQAETAQQNIDRMTLRAPRDGYVSVQTNPNIEFLRFRHDAAAPPDRRHGARGSVRRADSRSRSLGSDGAHRRSRPRPFRRRPACRNPRRRTARASV